MKKILALVVVLVVVALLGAAAWFLFLNKEVFDPNPRGFVPPTADLYAEVPSLGDLNRVSTELAGLTGVPFSFQALAARYTGAIATVLTNPAGSGMDESRPLGLIVRFSGVSKPLIVAALPIRDAKAFGAAVSADPGAMRDKPTSIQGGAVLLRRGYALVADDPQNLTDLLSLETGTLLIPAPTPGSAASIYITPTCVAAFQTLASTDREGMPQSARLGVKLAARMLDAITDLQLDLLSEADAFRLHTIISLKPGNGLEAAFQGAAGTPAMLPLLPPSGLVAGARMNPEGMRKVVVGVLNDLESLLPDSALAGLMRESLDLMSTEAGVSFIAWDRADPAGLRTVSLQSIPEGHETDFLRVAQLMRERGSEAYQGMMRGAGLENTQQTMIALPETSYRGITITGVSVRTKMKLDVPINADERTRELFTRMSDQEMQQRFARVLNPVTGRVAGRELYVTAAGKGPLVIQAAIDRLLDSDAIAADPSLSTTANPGWTRAVAALGQDIVAWIIADPMVLAGASPTPRQPLAITLRVKTGQLQMDVILPKENIKDASSADAVPAGDESHP